MATKPFYGDPAASAPVFNKYAVLLAQLSATVPTAPAAFTLNNTTRTASVTTATSTTITGPTGTFSAADIGLAITGTGIPASTTITAVASGTSATISQAATASATITATIGTAVTGQWDPVGALVEDNPFSDGEESIDVTEHTAAGFGVYAKTYKNQEETIEFTALETTLTTLGILYDASDLTDTAGVISGKLKQRDPSEKFLIAFQREHAIAMERRISENYAQINTITRNRSNDRAEYTVSVTIFPTSDTELYDYYLGPLA